VAPEALTGQSRSDTRRVLNRLVPVEEIEHLEGDAHAMRPMLIMRGPAGDLSRRTA
jgi:hypothetical protein